MSQEKRYQVFISSTFLDLVDERREALKGVLQMRHMPAGMELFPATDDDAWQLIQGVIDASDYYVVIIGGRYGTQDDEGIGYTEREYDYAFESKKPIIPLLHADPDSLRQRTDSDEAAWKKLQAFRQKVQARHHCSTWSSPGDLRAQLIVGLTETISRKPGPGWVRADQIPSAVDVSTALALRQRVAELEAELLETQTGPAPDSADLQQGDDTVVVHVSVRNTYDTAQLPSVDLNLSWNYIFGGIAPRLLHDTLNDVLRRDLLCEFFESLALAKVTSPPARTASCSGHDIDTCVVQFQALGLIKASAKPVGIDTQTVWNLTPYGERMKVQLRALRRDPKGEEGPSASNVGQRDGSGAGGDSA